MKYVVKSLAVNAGKKVYRSGDIVTESIWGKERTAELVKGGHIEPVADTSAVVQSEMVDAKAAEKAAKEAAKAAEKAEKEAAKAAEKAAKAAAKPAEKSEPEPDENTTAVNAPEIDLSNVNLGDENL